MSVAVACWPTSTGVYSPAYDRALSAAGGELRESIEVALAPETALGPPRLMPDEQMLWRVSVAMHKGAVNEGFSVDVATFRRLFEVLATLPHHVPTPEIVVESEREIALDWHEGVRRVLSVTVDDSSYLGFAALLGHEPLHGRMPFVGTLPKTLAYLLDRLYDTPIGTARP